MTEYRIAETDAPRPFKIVEHNDVELACSEDLEKTEKIMIIVTGYPEKAGELVTPKGGDPVYLDSAFLELAERKIGLVQVPLGRDLLALKKAPNRLSAAFSYVEKNAEGKEISLVVYSAGAMSLYGLDNIPQQVNQIVFMAPFLGRDCVRKDTTASMLASAFGRLLGMPSTEKYIKKVARLLKRFPGIIKTMTFSGDEIIDSEFIENVLSENIENLHTRMFDGGHAPSLDLITKRIIRI